MKKISIYPYVLHSILILMSYGSVAQPDPVDQFYESDIETSQAMHVLETSDGNYLISGSKTIFTDFFVNQGCVQLVSPQGDLLWSASAGVNLVNSVLHAVELDNSFIVAGNSDVGALILKLDKNSGTWLDSTSMGPCEIGAIPPVPFFAGNCGHPFIGKNGLLKSGDGFIVGGYYPFKTNRAYVARFDEDLNVDQSFRDRIDQHISNEILWGKEIIDIERSMVDDDIIFFGTIDVDTQECGMTCSDDVDCSPCNDDVWVLRFNNTLGLEYSRNLFANACETLVDATATPDNGFAIIGSSTSNSCSSFGPGSQVTNFSGDWFWKLDVQAQTQLTSSLVAILPVNLAFEYSGRSIVYDDGYLIGGCLEGELTKGLIAHYTDTEDFQTNWAYLDNCFLSCYEYSIPTGSCYMSAGFCRLDANSSDRKILHRFGECQFTCENAIEISCGQSIEGNNGDSIFGISQVISDYTFCEPNGTNGFDGPELTYEITGFNGGDHIFIGIHELDQDDLLDLCVTENCRLEDSDGEPSEFCAFVDRGNASDPVARIIIPNVTAESTYNAIVDSRGNTGDFRISVSCMDDCSDYPQLVCDQSLDADARGGNNRRICAYFCADAEDPYQDQYTSAEFGAYFVAPEDGDYTFRLSDISGNPDLFILSKCDPFSCLARSQNLGTNEEMATVFLTADQTVYLLVDSREGNSQSVLSVECCNDITCGCEDAIDVRCGFFVEGNNRNGKSKLSDYRVCDTEAMGLVQKELIYRLDNMQIDPFKPTDIFIDFEELNQNVGLDVFVVENCNSANVDEVSPAQCIVSSLRSDRSDNPSFLTIPQANSQSEYYIIVDAQNRENDFRLSISCPEDCNNTGPLECNDTIISRFNNNTNGSAKICSYYHPDDERHFTRYDAADLKSPFIPPRDGIYTFRISEFSNGNLLDLFILDECDPFSCIGYSVGGTGVEESVQLVLDANDTVYVIVDGQGTETESDFTLMVECCEAGASQVFLDNQETDATICLGSNDPSILNMIHSGSESAPYQFILTDTFDVIQEEISTSFDAARLTRGKYRIYGVSYLHDLFLDEGGLVTEVTGSICAIVSDNFINVCVDSAYQIFIDTTLCFGEGLLVCDTLLSDTGEHQINCISQSGCDSIISVNLSIERPEVEISGNLSFCSNRSTTLFATPGFASYLWSNEDEQETIPVATPGLYSVTVTTENGCTDSDTVEVTAFEDQGFRLISDTTICSGDEISLVQTSFCVDCSCSWTPETGLDDANVCNPMARPNQRTTYILTAVSQDDCEVRDSVTIDVAESPQARITASAEVICLGDSVVLDGNGGECEWLLPDGTNALTCIIIPSPDEDQSYRFVASVDELCYDTASIDIRVVDPPDINLIEDTSICQGLAIDLISDSDCLDCECSWTPRSGFFQPDDCGSITRPEVSTTYILEATKEGVCRVIDSVAIEVRESRTVKANNDHFVLRKNNTGIILLDSVLVNDSIINLGIALRLEQIFFEIIRPLPSDFPPQINIEEQTDRLIIDVGDVLGLDTFQYIITDRNCGSSDTGTIQLQVVENDQVSLCNPDEERVGCKVLDGIEDYENNDIAIFDREGTLVHVKKQYLNDWDGRHILTGERVPTGSYYFVLALREHRQTRIDGGTIKGVITIVRR